MSLVLHSCLMHGTFRPTHFLNGDYEKPDHIKIGMRTWSTDLRFDLTAVDGDSDTESPYLERVLPQTLGPRARAASPLDLVAAWWVSRGQKQNRWGPG